MAVPLFIPFGILALGTSNPLEKTVPDTGKVTLVLPVVVNTVLKAPVLMTTTQGILDLQVQTSSGMLGLKTDLGKKFRLGYYNPQPLDTNILFKVDDKDWGKIIMKKYK